MICMRLHFLYFLEGKSVCSFASLKRDSSTGVVVSTLYHTRMKKSRLPSDERKNPKSRAAAVFSFIYKQYLEKHLYSVVFQFEFVF